MQPKLSYPSTSAPSSRTTRPRALALVSSFSVRPGIGKMLINVDISTAIYICFPLPCLCFIHLPLDQGPLLRLCLEFMGKNHPSELSPTHGLPDRERLCLQRFSCGIRILTTHCGPDGKKHTTLCALKKLSTAPANKLTFTMRKGQSMTIADYFQRTQNKPLQFPDVIWAEVGSGALVSLELCDVPPE
ncbi:PAZ domain-containing protein [Mycena olivaceomarginata]|nr:PAZ domain-containing protein [Mycena olivaceomarginata]